MHNRDFLHGELRLLRKRLALLFGRQYLKAMNKPSGTITLQMKSVERSVLGRFHAVRKERGESRPWKTFAHAVDLLEEDLKLHGGYHKPNRHD